MLCSNCKKRSTCNEPCKKVEERVLKSCNGISTHRNKEIGECEITYEYDGVQEYLRLLQYGTKEAEIKERDQFHEEWMQIMKAIDNLLTHKQKVYIKLYIEGDSFAAIGRMFNVTGTAVRYAIFGHPAHGGGAVRKIQIALGIVEK